MKKIKSRRRLLKIACASHSKRNVMEFNHNATRDSHIAGF